MRFDSELARTKTVLSSCDHAVRKELSAPFSGLSRHVTETRSYQRLKLLDDAQDFFLARIEEAEKLSGNRSRMSTWSLAGADVKKYFFTDAHIRIDQWQDTVRYVDALYAGHEHGAISLGTAEDVKAFDDLFDRNFFVYPQLVEYYVATGELLEVVRRIDADFRERIISDFGFVLSSRVVNAFRLYECDLMQVRAHLDRGDDPAAYMSLPLDIRVELSGFFDRALDRENDQNMTIDHREVFDQDTLRTLGIIT